VRGLRAILLSICLAALGGCQPLALSVLGAAGGEALRYSYSGVTYRTFTASAADVKHASLEALERMGIAFESFDRFESGELIYSDDKGSFVIDGQLIDLKKKANITRERLNVINRVNIKDLPLDQAAEQPRQADGDHDEKSVEQEVLEEPPHGVCIGRPCARTRGRLADDEHDKGRHHDQEQQAADHVSPPFRSRTSARGYPR